MSITSDKALEQLKTWTTNSSLLNHARAVQIAMELASVKYGMNPDQRERWGLTGLLHDADYDQWPEEHPRKIVQWLNDQGESEMAYAISAHNTHLGIPPQSVLDKALIACDELTGFVIACCLVRPGGISTLSPKSVKKKLKDRSFAAKVNREEILHGVELLGAELGEHIQFVIDALRPHAEELGIRGTSLR